MEETGRRRVLLGVTGGIAAYKVAELARALIRNNVQVQVAMTAAGTKFVTPATFQALTGRPVVTDLWDASFPNAMAHIELSRGVDAIVVAPASADFLAKLAHGLADDLLSTTCLARNCALLVAPDEEGDLRQIERAVGKRLPRVQVPDFDYTQKSAEKLEIPLAERIAAIRARKAEDRARAKANAERRAAHAAGPASRPAHGQPPRAAQGSSSRPAHGNSSQPAAPARPAGQARPGAPARPGSPARPGGFRPAGRPGSRDARPGRPGRGR